MSMSTERYAQQTLETRLKVHELVSSGMSESQALNTVLPKDTNRSRKLKSWKERGLWPISEHELTQARTVTEHTVTQQVDNQNTLYDTAFDSQTHTSTQQDTDYTHTETQTRTSLEHSLPQLDTIKEHTIIQLNTEDLRELVQQVVNETLGGIGKQITRPRFKRQSTIARSVRLGKELSERADKKAREDIAISGGNLNGLIEYLLWNYLGKPMDLTIE